MAHFEADRRAVHVSFHDNDWALGSKYADALQRRGYIVVTRVIPGSVRAFTSASFLIGGTLSGDAGSAGAWVAVPTPRIWRGG
jgi:hypothetical protein